MRRGGIDGEDGVSEGEMKVVYVSSGCLDCLKRERETGPLLSITVEVNRPS